MKSSVGFSFLALAGLVLLVGLGCLTTTVQPTAAPATAAIPPTSEPPTSEPFQLATQPPPDTAVPPSVPTDTLEPTLGGAQYFTEEFLQDLDSNWAQLLKGSGALHTDKLSTSFKNGKMHMEIDTNELYVYYFYTPYTYTDVRLDLQVENIGVNSQNVSLVCRSDGDQWYEFSVGSDGLWTLWAYKKSNSRSYNELASAGAATLKQGHATNEYGMSCIGDKIHLYVNGTELPYSPVKTLNYFFLEGQVGFNISSIESTPVIVDVDWFKISQP
jgi:hypothetical protein